MIQGPEIIQCAQRYINCVYKIEAWTIWLTQEYISHTHKKRILCVSKCPPAYHVNWDALGHIILSRTAQTCFLSYICTVYIIYKCVCAVWEARRNLRETLGLHQLLVGVDHMYDEIAWLRCTTSNCKALRTNGCLHSANFSRQFKDVGGCVLSFSWLLHGPPEQTQFTLNCVCTPLLRVLLKAVKTAALSCWRAKDNR